MSRVAIIVLALLLASLAPGNPEASFVEAPIYRAERVLFSRQVRLRNRQGQYRLDFVQLRPQGNRGAIFQIYLREPTVYYSFSRPLDSFLDLQVNGIALKWLEPRTESFSCWQRGEQAGVDLALNFDGARVLLSFCMRRDSPVLWAKVTPQAGGTVRTAQLSLFAVPSGMVPGQLSEGYQRIAIHAEGQREQGDEAWVLPAGIDYLVLTDEALEPGQREGTIGPCYVVFDATAAERGLLEMRNSYRLTLTFQLDPSKVFAFGVWESSRPYANADFLELLDASRAAFSLSEVVTEGEPRGSGEAP